MASGPCLLLLALLFVPWAGHASGAECSESSETTGAGPVAIGSRTTRCHGGQDLGGGRSEGDATSTAEGIFVDDAGASVGSWRSETGAWYNETAGQERAECRGTADAIAADVATVAVVGFTDRWGCSYRSGAYEEDRTRVWRGAGAWEDATQTYVVVHVVDERRVFDDGSEARATQTWVVAGTSAADVHVALVSWGARYGEAQRCTLVAAPLSAEAPQPVCEAPADVVRALP